MSAFWKGFEKVAEEPYRKMEDGHIPKDIKGYGKPKVKGYIGNPFVRDQGDRDIQKAILESRKLKKIKSTAERYGKHHAREYEASKGARKKELKSQGEAYAKHNKAYANNRSKK